MSLADQADLWAEIRLMIRDEIGHYHDGSGLTAQDGIVANGSWNPADGTISVWMNETSSILVNRTEQPLPRQGIQLLAPVHGQQAGPIGGERVILIRRHSGWIAVLEHGLDDSPGAPAGESWMTQQSGDGGSQKSSIKLKNGGDVSITAANAHQVTAASSTHEITGTEAHSAQMFTATATSAASITAPSVQIGPTGGPNLSIGSSGYNSADAPILEAAFAAFYEWALTHVHVPGGENTGPPLVPPPMVPGASNVSIS